MQITTVHAHSRLQRPPQQTPPLSWPPLRWYGGDGRPHLSFIVCCSCWWLHGLGKGRCLASGSGGGAQRERQRQQGLPCMRPRVCCSRGASICAS